MRPKLNATRLGFGFSSWYWPPRHLGTTPLIPETGSGCLTNQTSVGFGYQATCSLHEEDLP